jgi:hypothetical protein
VDGRTVVDLVSGVAWRAILEAEGRKKNISDDLLKMLRRKLLRISKKIQRFNGKSFKIQNFVPRREKTSILEKPLDF